MPKRIITRSASGNTRQQLIFRTGHHSKLLKMCSTMPDPCIDGVTYIEQMNQINKNFFEPFFNDPYSVDPDTIYLDLLTFLESERKRYLISRPDIVTQVEFMINAMTLVRKDASQYFIKNLQNTAMARQIEGSIQGLLMHIYLLNTRIAILQGDTGKTSLSGGTRLEVAQMKNPKYVMAQFQPHLSMLSFLYPDEPSAKYYTRLARLLKYSGLYDSDKDISNDLTAFLDRYLVQHDLSLTLEQWLALKEDNKVISEEEQEYIEENIEYIEDSIEYIESVEKTLDEWRDKRGSATILDGTLKITTSDIDTILRNRYHANTNNLDRQIERFKHCQPKHPSGVIEVNVDSNGRVIRSLLIDGNFTMSHAHGYSFDLENLSNLTPDNARDIINKLHPATTMSANPPPSNIKDPTPSSPKSKTSYYPSRSKTCKNYSTKSSKNKTRKNICH